MPSAKLSPARPKTTRNGETKKDYHVADISLADLGRREIGVAEQEMPGLMSIRAKYGPQKPLQGVRVSGS
jgi:adenosylhomocysteinase